jgi:hypothetical protein
MYGRNMFQDFGRGGGGGGFSGSSPGGFGTTLDPMAFGDPQQTPQYEEGAPVYYTEGGKVIKKRNLIDPSTGESFPIYEEFRTLPANMPVADGTVVDPDNIYGSIVAQQQAPPQEYVPRAPQAAVQDTGIPSNPPAAPASGGNMPGGSSDFSPEGIRQQAQAAVTGGGGANAGQQIAASGGGDLNGLFKNALLYDPDNAKMAVTNVLKDMGINPNNAGNIFAQMIGRAAPGLGLAFREQMAQQPASAVAPSTPGSPPPDFGGQFQQFLRSAIGGGNVMGTLHNAATALPAIIQALRGLGENDANAQNVNPFAQALMDTLGANSGQGTIAALAALNGPAMSQSMLSGYTRGLTNAGTNALRTGANDAFFQSGEGKPNYDIWHYLLGI